MEKLSVKRLLYILICLSMLLVSAVPAYAEASREELSKITTPHLILYEADSGTILYEKNCREKAEPASTTKIMTCIVALEYCTNLDAVYTCGNESVNGFGSASSLLGLQPGYKVTIKDMLYGLMLTSGNDCGACLAVATSGSMDGFIALMNKKAEELGMTDTHYTNAHGLHNENHYTTAYDMALLMKYALQSEAFREIISSKQYTVNETAGKLTKTIYNSNKLIYTKDTDTEENIYPYAIGGKTGETNWAGYCLVAAAEKDGVTLITVLMGDNNMGGTSTYYRFRNARKLFDYGFAQYITYGLDHYGVTNLFNVQTIDYDQNSATGGVITAEVDISSVRISGAREEIDSITEQSFTWMEPVLDEAAITAPVFIGDKLGTVTLLMNGTELFTGDLIAKEMIDKKAPDDVHIDDPGAIVDSTEEPTGRRDECGLTVSRDGGEPENTVWFFWNSTLYTTEDKANTSFFLFLDGDVFRSAKVPGVAHEVRLYKRTVSESGIVSFDPVPTPEAGESYVVVSNGKALTSVKDGTSLAAAAVTIGEDGSISSEVSANMIWTFKENGGGYNLLSNGNYLHRVSGNGLLFWLLIGILVIGLAIVIYLLVTSRTRRRNPRTPGRYKIYSM